jgi:hypothetical protein
MDPLMGIVGAILVARWSARRSKSFAASWLSKAASSYVFQFWAHLSRCSRARARTRARLSLRSVTRFREILPSYSNWRDLFKPQDRFRRYLKSVSVVRRIERNASVPRDIKMPYLARRPAVAYPGVAGDAPVLLTLCWLRRSQGGGMSRRG